MKLLEFLNLKDSIELLTKVKFSDFKITLDIYNLSKKANEMLDLYRQEHSKIVEEYVQKDDNGNVMIDDKRQFMFKNDEDRQKFINSVTELNNTEITDINKIDISIEKIQGNNNSLTADVMLKLDPIITWC